MLDNNDIRAALVGWMKDNTDIVGVLISGSSSANEIREKSWQGEDFVYPNIRVTCSSTPNQCAYSDVNATISFFSEKKSSKESLIGQGRIAKEMHNKSVKHSTTKFENMRVISLPDAIQEGSIWKADVLLSMKVYALNE